MPFAIFIGEHNAINYKSPLNSPQQLLEHSCLGDQAPLVPPDVQNVRLQKIWKPLKRLSAAESLQGLCFF
jgi:hypothetical protein